MESPEPNGMEDNGPLPIDPLTESAEPRAAGQDQQAEAAASALPDQPPRDPEPIELEGAGGDAPVEVSASKQAAGGPGPARRTAAQARRSAWANTAILFAVTFASEFLAMVVIHAFPDPPAWVEPLVDSLVLSGLMLPAFVLFVLRPLTRQITERERAEEALRESEYFFRESQRAASIGSYTCDFVADRWESSEVLNQIFGIGHDYDRSVQSWLELTHPGDREMMARYLAEEVMAKRTSFNKDYRIVRKSDGDTRWVTGLGEIAVDADGNVLSMIGTIQDITERKLAEDALRASEARFRAVVGAVPAAVWIHNGERLVFVNEATTAITGYSPDELAQPGFLQGLLVPEDAAAVVARAGCQLRGEPVEPNRDYRFVRRDGQVRWMANSMTSITFEGRRSILSVSVDITERKLAEDQLRTLSRAVEQSPASIVITDCDGAIQFVNARFEEVTGYSSAEVIGQNPRILKSGLTPPETYAELWAAITEGGEWRGELCNRRKNGELYWEQAAISGLKDERGEVNHYLAVKEDITERKRAEEAMRESEARFRRLIENSPDVVYVYSQTRGGIYYSPRVEAVLGYSAEFLTTHPFTWNESIHPEDRPSVERALDAVRDGMSFAVEYRIRDASGNWKWLYDRSMDVRVEAGETLNEGLATDITERKLAEEAIRESEARFRAVVDTVPAAIRIYDGERMVFANDANSALTGYSHEEILAPGWLQRIVHPEERPALARRETRRLRGEGVSQHYTGRIVRKDGQVRWAANHAVPITFEGRPATLVTSTDITDRKRSVDERRQLDLKMQHAQKLESLGVLAGGIAHDFNNLLAAVLGNASLALMEISPESPARESIEEIEVAARRAADLTAQMLAYSGRGHFVVGPLNLARAVEEIANLLEVAISKQVRLVYHFDPATPLIVADATQIRQVVMNLITNASDAIGETAGVISISTGMLSPDRAYLSETYLDNDLPEGDYAFVEVIDTGSGMDEETRLRIFDPFFTTKFTGRGLGLAAVLGIVRGHHGAIKIASEPGRGTTFRVLFPVADPSMVIAPAPVPPSAKVLAQSVRAHASILLVDDDDTVRTITRRVLERLGYTIMIAGGGAEAVAIFQRQSLFPDLVLLDMTMPGMDGRATFRELRRIDPAARIVLMSGYPEADATEQFQGEGLNGFIQKPFRLDELLVAIDSALA